MSDYIERGAVIEWVESWLNMDRYFRQNGEHDSIPITELYALLKRIPTVDAVPVVRCRDCKWWVRDGNDSFGYAMFCDHDCSLGGQGIKKPEDYCSYGERKGGDE